MMFRRFGEKTKYLVCRCSSILLGLVPTLCVLVSSVLRLLVYAGTCDTEEPSMVMVCTALKSTHEGVTYHLIFAIAGLVFCCLNSAINIVFYFVQSKMMLGSWLTWTFLCAAGHFVVSFEQNIVGPMAWFQGDLIGVLSFLYQSCLIVCWAAVIVVHFGQRPEALSKDHEAETIPLQQI